MVKSFDDKIELNHSYSSDERHNMSIFHDGEYVGALSDRYFPVVDDFYEMNAENFLDEKTAGKVSKIQSLDEAQALVEQVRKDDVSKLKSEEDLTKATNALQHNSEQHEIYEFVNIVENHVAKAISYLNFQQNMTPAEKQRGYEYLLQNMRAATTNKKTKVEDEPKGFFKRFSRKEMAFKYKMEFVDAVMGSENTFELFRYFRSLNKEIPQASEVLGAMLKVLPKKLPSDKEMNRIRDKSEDERCEKLNRTSESLSFEDNVHVLTDYFCAQKKERLLQTKVIQLMSEKNQKTFVGLEQQMQKEMQNLVGGKTENSLVEKKQNAVELLNKHMEKIKNIANPYSQESAETILRNGRRRDEEKLIENEVKSLRKGYVDSVENCVLHVRNLPLQKQAKVFQFLQETMDKTVKGETIEKPSKKFGFADGEKNKTENLIYENFSGLQNKVKRVHAEQDNLAQLSETRTDVRHMSAKEIFGPADKLVNDFVYQQRKSRNLDHVDVSCFPGVHNSNQFNFSNKVSLMTKTENNFLFGYDSKVVEETLARDFEIKRQSTIEKNETYVKGLESRFEVQTKAHEKAEKRKEKLAKVKEAKRRNVRNETENILGPKVTIERAKQAYKEKHPKAEFAGKKVEVTVVSANMDKRGR